MYKLSKEMSSLLNDYGFGYGEDYGVEWIIEEASCNTMFDNPEMFTGNLKTDYEFIMNAALDEDVLMYGDIV